VNPGRVASAPGRSGPPPASSGRRYGLRVPVDLGQLPLLLDALGSAVTINPILEKRLVVGSVTISGYQNVVAAWEISFTTAKGSFTYRRESVAEAVEQAFADESSWG